MLDIFNKCDTKQIMHFADVNRPKLTTQIVFHFLNDYDKKKEQPPELAACKVVIIWFKIMNILSKWIAHHYFMDIINIQSHENSVFGLFFCHYKRTNKPKHFQVVSTVRILKPFFEQRACLRTPLALLEEAQKNSYFSFSQGTRARVFSCFSLFMREYSCTRICGDQHFQ